MAVFFELPVGIPWLERIFYVGQSSIGKLRVMAEEHRLETGLVNPCKTLFGIRFLVVTVGVETVGFTEMIQNSDGYRHLENLGTEPSVYYLPATNRDVPFEKGLEGKDEELLKRYERTPYFKNKKNG